MEEENWYNDLYNFFSPDEFIYRMRKDKKSAENHWMKIEGNLVYKYFKPSEFQQLAQNLRQKENADWPDGMDIMICPFIL